MEEENVQFNQKSFPDHLVQMLRNVGKQNLFADVTLVSDDQIQMQAHKFMLSACSPVLRNILITTSINTHHPLVYLRGIKHTELQAILKFIYFGETQILKERINEFISVANNLEIKEISAEQPQHKFEDDDTLVNNSDDYANSEPDKHGEDDTEEEVTKSAALEENRIANSFRAIVRSVQQKNGKHNCEQCSSTFQYSASLANHRKNIHEGMKTMISLEIFSINPILIQV